VHGFLSSSDRIVLNDPDHGAAIGTLAGARFMPDVDIAVARVRYDKLIGGVIFTNFTGESICIHTASWDEHWVNRRLIFVVFDYPFNQLGVKRIFGRLPETNERAHSFNLHCGFRDVARVEGVYEHNVAQIIMRLDREDCRFLGLRPEGITSNLN
jgi:RimJ/RimL family protein N-acetyltransferase